MQGSITRRSRQEGRTRQESEISNVLELQLNMKLIPKAKGKDAGVRSLCEEEEAQEKIKGIFTQSLRTSDGMVCWLYLQIRN